MAPFHIGETNDDFDPEYRKFEEKKKRRPRLHTNLSLDIKYDDQF